MNTSPRQIALDTSFMRAALEQAAAAASMGEVPVGAVLVRDGQVIGCGHNRSRADMDPSAHAEIVAMRQAAQSAGNYRLEKATLYVTIEPCLMCCGALLQARVQRLVFGAREPRGGAVVSTWETLMTLSQKHRIAISEGILQHACAGLMQEFFAVRRD